MVVGATVPAVGDEALDRAEQMATEWDRARRVAVPRLSLAACDAVVLLTAGDPPAGGAAHRGEAACAAEVVAGLAAASPLRGRVPMVHPATRLPDFVGPRTLVVALGLSHAGGAHDPGAIVTAALRRGARVLATSGTGGSGRLALPAEVHCIGEAGGTGAGMGGLAVPVLRALGLDTGLDEAVQVLHAVVGRWRRESPEAVNEAKQTGMALAASATPVICSTGYLASVAARRLSAGLRAAGMDPVCSVSRYPVASGSWSRSGRAACAWTDGLVVVGNGAQAPRTRPAVGTTPLARLASLLAFGDFAAAYAAGPAAAGPTPGALAA